MTKANKRALPPELVAARNDFIYINPDCPEINIVNRRGESINSFHGGVVRSGRLIKVFSSPELQYKEFDFGVPFGPIGWNYFYFKVVLQRISHPGTPAQGLFIFDYASSSYGRYSGALPWQYDVMLLSGDTPLRKIHLATDFIEECHSEHRASFQTPIPQVPGVVDFPIAFYEAVDSLRLEAGGNQESCN